MQIKTPELMPSPRGQLPDRIGAVGGGAECRALLERLVGIAQAGLPAMYRADIRQFAFTRRRLPNGSIVAAGESRRYGAITLLGARGLPSPVQRAIFGGETASEYCNRMIETVHQVQNLGDAALLAWAAAETRHCDVERAVRRVTDLCDEQPEPDTVVLSWIVSALVAVRDQLSVEEHLVHAHSQLLQSFNSEAGVFGHVTSQSSPAAARSHVSCFADQVYPIQALARFHRAFTHQHSLDVAEQCAELICRVQGAGGQWWWHYDARTGAVLEGYPVYSVHQHAMGPMALLDLADAGGTRRDGHIRRGLLWLVNAPEIGASLIDDDNGVVWRKVGRTDPAKFVRKARAAASRIHPKIRLSVLDSIFRPARIDFECRPYEFGWLLYAWLHTL